MFEINNLKKGFAEASHLFSRAKQFTGEKLGNAERTCYDQTLENLLQRSDSSKFLTERMISNMTSILQPNPSNNKTQKTFIRKTTVFFSFVLKLLNLCYT